MPMLLSFILFFIPFFWLAPGEMDIGGDSSRLYFYDPMAFLAHTARWSVVGQGTGAVEPNFYYLPYVGLIALLKAMSGSSWFVISLVSGLKLAGAFLGTYGVARLLIGATRAVAIVSGLFYTFSTLMIGNWAKALTSHNQIAINPVMFYLFLRFILTRSWRYMATLLLISFLFAPSFGITSAPPFFGFYPLALFYALLFVGYVQKRPLPWKGLFAGGVFFLGIQAFHLLPQAVSLFDPGSFANTRVFDKQAIVHEGIRYFLGVLPLAKTSINLLLPSPVKPLSYLSFIVPMVVITGFLLCLPKGRRLLALTAAFFLVTLYLLSANVTDAGVFLYRQLFWIPGFSMFRNFIGQWPPAYIFFYTILFGMGLGSLIQRLPRTLGKVALFALAALFLAGGWPLVSGTAADPVHPQSNGVRISMRMDPRYEEFLRFVRGLPDDGKILTLPLTDAFYQVLPGVDDGAYVGPSTISNLTPKRDFAGYQVLAPFSEDLMRFAREGEAKAFLQILSLLNIRYIFHNEDPRAYEQGFPGFPYTYMKTSFPKTQEEYRTLIAAFPVRLRYKNGPYALYETDSQLVRPEVYIADFLDTRIATEGGALVTTTRRSAFVDEGICQYSGMEKYCRAPQTIDEEVSVQKISPVEYLVRIARATGKPFLLVFGNMFHSGWRLEEEDRLIRTAQVQVNGYANGWVVGPGDESEKREYYTLRITLDTQKYFRWGLVISAVSLIALGGSLMRTRKDKR